MLHLLFATALAAAPRPHVDDLPTDVVPADLSFDPVRERLVVDGALVRGSRADQLEWLRAAFDDHPALRIDERKRALAHRRATGAVVAAAGLGGCAVMLVAPPTAAVLVPTLAAQGAVDGAALVVGRRAHRRFDAQDLAVQLERLQITLADAPW